MYLNYSCPLEESKVFPSKSNSNINNNLKKDEFEVNLAITELFL